MPLATRHPAVPDASRTPKSTPGFEAGIGRNEPYAVASKVAACLSRSVSPLRDAARKSYCPRCFSVTSGAGFRNEFASLSTHDLFGGRRPSSCPATRASSAAGRFNRRFEFSAMVRVLCLSRALWPGPPQKMAPPWPRRPAALVPAFVYRRRRSVEPRTLVIPFAPAACTPFAIRDRTVPSPPAGDQRAPVWRVVCQIRLGLSAKLVRRPACAIKSL